MILSKANTSSKCSKDFVLTEVVYVFMSDVAQFSVGENTTPELYLKPSNPPRILVVHWRSDTHVTLPLHE